MLTIRIPTRVRSAVTISLSALLDLDVVRDAKPEVMVGHSGLDRAVRWVHSSEIFEIGPLLAGGELLLTTGLGLAGVDTGARRHYLRELAQRGVAALAVELGRTFRDMPPELVLEAEAHDFPLIALHSVVPFILISETVNTLIVDESVGRLRLSDDVSRALNASLVSGSGVPGLLSTAGLMIDGPLVVISAGGALIAAHGVGDHRDVWGVVESARMTMPIILHGGTWGSLHAGAGAGGRLSDAELAVVLERTSSAVSLAVMGGGRPASHRESQVDALLADLLQGAAVEVQASLRAGLVGFHPGRDDRLVGVAVESPDPRAAVAVLERCAVLLGGPGLCGQAQGHSVGLVSVPGQRVDAVESVRAAADEARQTSGAPEVRIGVGHPVGATHGLVRGASSLWDALLVLQLIPRTVAGASVPAVMTSRTYALELELLRRADATGLDELAMRTIGPVIAWDQSHGSQLVHTLEVFLRNGCSPTRTASALHLGRQSLYQRIERIESLLGHSVTGPDLLPALLVAVCSQRLATLI
jgi:PucR family transcriptional regulator, purine catabolism regulatory protein